MIDEIVLLSGSRLILLAAISYTMWSLHGIFWRDWSVGTLFFWMWWELLLSGISTTILVHRWRRITTLSPKDDSPAAIAGVTFLMLFFATLFAALALGAEGVSIQQGTLGDYIRPRRETMGVIMFVFLAVHLMTAHGKRFPETPQQQIVKPLTNRMFPVLAIYAISIIDHHWYGRHELDNSHSHQLLLGGCLLGVKLLLELRQFYRTS